ncbi:DUF4870 domain-containing protein [uncultured Polaribacter sp.]|uniref:DUF4870 domain-containing protein n=1 Tax=uncultured Polaribacter sp. TaxID=174711 RepID=UPI00261E9839|nr:DUF4870 domain-containing protein [uncultured Polaribacter sp.]
MNRNNENTNAFLIHISAFAGFMFPFGHIITPLIAWQSLKDRSTFLDEQGKEAVNFNISYTLYTFILALSFVPFAFGTFFKEFRHANNFNFNINFNSENLFQIISLGSLTSLLYIVSVVLVIIAAIKARDGENYKYPFTIKFIK